MTEIDRLLQKGVMPESFLFPETRCGFFVDEKRKKTWAIAIDLLLTFDEVLHLEQQADKTDYIIPKGAIFIDDSNAERLNVMNRLNIPVFSPEMIDVLN